MPAPNASEQSTLREALDAVFSNQMNLAAEKHCLLKVLKRDIPKPQWHLVVSDMPEPLSSSSSSSSSAPDSQFVYFDGWDLYSTREEALDCMYVNPLVRTADADYVERDAADATTFVHYLVDGERHRGRDAVAKGRDAVAKGRDTVAKGRDTVDDRVRKRRDALLLPTPTASNVGEEGDSV